MPAFDTAQYPAILAAIVGSQQPAQHYSDRCTVSAAHFTAIPAAVGASNHTALKSTIDSAIHQTVCSTKLNSHTAAHKLAKWST